MGPIGEDDLQAFVDGRLPPGRHALVEAYLQANADVARQLAGYRADRAALAERLRPRAVEPIPARLRVAAIIARRRGERQHWMQRLAVACVLLAVGAGIGASAGFLLGAARREAAAPSEDVAALAVAAHRLFITDGSDVMPAGAGHEDRLSRWVSARLGHPLPIPDLAAQGYRLTGGRIVPAGEAPAALITYDNAGGTRLTLYIKAGEAGETPRRFVTQDGLSSIVWRDDGCGYAISAALDRDALDAVADEAFRQMEAADVKS